MVRLLFWILLAVVAYGVVKSWSRPPAGRRPAPGQQSEPMVSCAACGLNVPQSEARARDGKWYCSREHLERAQPGSHDA